MLIFPAIDLKDSKAVRLYKGDFKTAYQVSEDPLSAVHAFLAAGARYLHMVDLDGARKGVRQHSGIVQAAVETGIKVELGGGIRTFSDLEAVFQLGIWRAVIGSAAVSNPDLVHAAIAAFGPERIAVGVDVKDGSVRTSGWESNSSLDYVDFARRMEGLGVRHLIFTDIDTDGTLSGPSWKCLEKLQNSVNCSITASGGISSNSDLRNLRDRGLYAAITGKALYAGRVDLALAIQEGGPQ